MSEAAPRPTEVPSAPAEAPRARFPLKVFLISGGIALAIILGLVVVAFFLGDSSLPFNYPGFDNK